MTLTRTDSAPVEVVTPIKPSEALRLGRLERPRHTPGQYLDGDDGACAVGAMATAWKGRGTEQLDVPTHSVITGLFDDEEKAGRDGDAAVLELLESRGL